MKKKIKYVLAFILFVAVVFCFNWDVFPQSNYSQKKVGPQPDGSILVPTNQLLRPAGFQITFPGRPVDLALSPDGKWLAVMNKNSLDLIRVLDRTIMQTLPFPKSGASFNGLAFSADGSKIYVSQARDRIYVAHKNENNILQWGKPIQFPKPKIGGETVPGGFVFNENEDKLYVTLSRSNSLAVVNMTDSSVTEIPVGVAPYDVVLLSPEKAYVSNWGGRRAKEGETTYKTSGSDILIDAKTGIANNGAISVVDLKTGAQTKYIEVGLHPGAMVFSPDKKRLYVACANSDIISVIDTKTDKVVDKISVRLQKDLPFGSAPNALTMSADGKRLYVANGTDNAVCVIQLDAGNKITGYIPTGWYPGAVIFDRDEKFLFVANTKGIGSRNLRADRPGYNTHHHMGSISIVPVPDQNTLKKMTEIVKENNSFSRMMEQLVLEKKTKQVVPVPQFPGQVSYFKHVVYIIKENRTYDQVFGDLLQGNGDTSLVHFGRKVTPNHHALAEVRVGLSAPHGRLFGLTELLVGRAHPGDKLFCLREEFDHQRSGNYLFTRYRHYVFRPRRCLFILSIYDFDAASKSAVTTPFSPVRG